MKTLQAEEKFILALREIGIDLILTNPCAKIKKVLILLRKFPEFDIMQLTREEHGIGIACGAFLAGKKPALLIQSTGLGNLINNLASLTIAYKLPLIILCSWRGIIDETIEAQKPLGQALEGIFDSLKVPIHKIKDENDLFELKRLGKKCYEKNEISIFLLSPRLWSQTLEIEDVSLSGKTVISYERTFSEVKDIELSLTRYQAISEIVNSIPYDCILVSNIGIPSKELFSIKDRASNFYMTGSYGQVSAIGLGVARYTQKPVVVLDGDGSLLMSPSLLGMAARYSKNNLSIVCLDNGTYGSTGNQPTLTYEGLDLERVARSFGIIDTCKTSTEEELKKIFRSDRYPSFIHVKIKPGDVNTDPIPLSNPEIADRFSNWLRNA